MSTSCANKKGTPNEEVAFENLGELFPGCTVVLLSIAIAREWVA